jgi:hypothetical protein
MSRVIDKTPWLLTIFFGIVHTDTIRDIISVGAAPAVY